MLVSVGDVNWGWTPLPTRPRRYCNPALLVSLTLTNGYKLGGGVLDVLIMHKPDHAFEWRLLLAKRSHVRRCVACLAWDGIGLVA